MTTVIWYGSDAEENARAGAFMYCDIERYVPCWSQIQELNHPLFSVQQMQG
jgi:hypothetical protein